MYSHGRCVCSCVAIELKGEMNWKRKNDWMSESKETKHTQTHEKNENCLSPVCWLHLNIMCIITMFELTLCFPFLFKWICAISHLVHIIDSIFRFVDNLAMCQYPTVIRYSFSCWWPFFYVRCVMRYPSFVIVILWGGIIKVQQKTKGINNTIYSILNERIWKRHTKSKRM